VCTLCGDWGERSLEAACSITTATADMRLGCSSSEGSEGSMDAAAQKLAQVSSHPSVSPSPFHVSPRMSVNGAAPEHMPHTSDAPEHTPQTRHAKSNLSHTSYTSHAPASQTTWLAQMMSHCSHNPCPTRCTLGVHSVYTGNQSTPRARFHRPPHRSPSQPPPLAVTRISSRARRVWTRVDTRGDTSKVGHEETPGKSDTKKVGHT
jgi:hypothetical protein